MPSGLLVDWGGVMTTSPFAAFSAFCAAEGLDPAAAANAFRHDRGARALLKDFETGAIDDAAFSAGFGALLGIADADGLAARLMGDLQLVEPMHDVVRRLRAAGVRTGMLSNSWGKDAYPRPLLPELFDVLVISGEERTRKPDPAIYAIACERMALPAEELVFVDDLPFNLEPARALGMTVVHHEEPGATVARLEELFA